MNDCIHRVSISAMMTALIVATATTASAQAVSSSGSSSSFVNSAGAGASSTAITISPNGTVSRSQVIFTPGATSSSASSTATVSTSGSNGATVSATTSASPTSASPATSPAPSVNSGVTSTSVGVSSVESSASRSTSFTAIGSRTIEASIIGLAPLPPSSPATFIPTFFEQSPLQNAADRIGIKENQRSQSVVYEVVGLPSRVFPGLGLQLVPVEAK